MAKTVDVRFNGGVVKVPERLLEQFASFERSSYTGRITVHLQNGHARQVESTEFTNLK